jgi:hypothetical protein
LRLPGGATKDPVLLFWKSRDRRVVPVASPGPSIAPWICTAVQNRQTDDVADRRDLYKLRQPATHGSAVQLLGASASVAILTSCLAGIDQPMTVTS